MIGLTEKELGKSIFERMKTIANLRIIMKEQDIEKPIHIFGSLDPIITPLYFLSGADIFDGLSWLKFNFTEDAAMYVDSYGVKKNNIFDPVEFYSTRAIYDNISFIRKLTQDLRQFVTTNDFDIFNSNSKLYKDSYNYLEKELEGKI